MQLRDVLRLSPFLTTHPKNRLLPPIIATLPKPPPASPLLATHSRSPRGVRCHSFRLVAFLSRHSSPATGFKFFVFKLLRTLLHSSKTQLSCFRAIPNSLRKTPGVGGCTWGCASHSETPSGAPRPLVTRRRISRSEIRQDPVPARSNSLSLLSPFCDTRFFPANLRRKGPSRF